MRQALLVPCSGVMKAGYTRIAGQGFRMAGVHIVFRAYLGGGDGKVMAVTRKASIGADETPVGAHSKVFQSESLKVLQGSAGHRACRRDFIENFRLFRWVGAGSVGPHPT